MEEKEGIRPHSCQVQNRSSVRLTGIREVVSFDEQQAVMDTDMGLLTIKGKDLHVSRLTVEQGEVDLEGTCLLYTSILPPMVNQVVNLVKNTSCLYIIGGTDLISVTYSFVTGASTGGAYAPAYLLSGLLFFVICFPLSTLASVWENSLKKRDARVTVTEEAAA